MFQFVTVNHPDEIKDRKKQGKLRQHAIRAGIQRSKADRAKKSGGSGAPEAQDKTTRSNGKRDAVPAALKAALMKAPAATLVDPFDTLTGCPERLRSLMQQQSSAQLANQGTTCAPVSTQKCNYGMETIFRSALSDPALFHILAHVIALNADKNLPKIEILSHRGYLLSGIQQNIKNRDPRPKTSTLVAMLLLIGYEYRIDGEACASIGTHIGAVRSMVKMCKDQKMAVVEEVHKALFYQDLISCLFAGTTRLLSHNDILAYQVPRDGTRFESYVVPYGFLPAAHDWPSAFTSVLEDLNALCLRVEDECTPDIAPLDVFAIDNYQANLHSRIVNCLSDCRDPERDYGPLYEACIHAAYIWTFKLSPGVWEGCYIPEVCVNQIFRCVSDVVKARTWRMSSDMILWLLVISGATTARKVARRRISRLIHYLFWDDPYNVLGDWNRLKEVMCQFIWSGYAMEQRIHSYWACLQSI